MRPEGTLHAVVRVRYLRNVPLEQTRNNTTKQTQEAGVSVSHENGTVAKQRQ